MLMKHNHVEKIARTVVPVIALLASTGVDASTDYAITIDRISYSDASGLSVDYGFTTMNPGPVGTVQIPASGITAPTPYWSNAVFGWEFPTAIPTDDAQTELTGTGYRMSIPQPTVGNPEPKGLRALGASVSQPGPPPPAQTSGRSGCA